MADGIVQAGDGAVRLIPYAAECCAVDRARGPFPHQPLNTTPNTTPSPPCGCARMQERGSLQMLAACRWAAWPCAPFHGYAHHAHPSMAMHTMRTLPWPCAPCAPPMPMRAPVLDLCVGITVGSVSGICTCALPSLGLRSGALPPSFFLGAAMEAGPSSPTSSSKLSKAGAGFEFTGAEGFGGGGGGAVAVVTSGVATSCCPTSSSSNPEAFTLNFLCFPDISQPIESADRLRSRTSGESVTQVRRGRACSPEHGSRRIGSAWIMPHWGSAPLHWHFQMVGYPPCNQARAHSALKTASALRRLCRLPNAAHTDPCVSRLCSGPVPGLCLGEARDRGKATCALWCLPYAYVPLARLIRPHSTVPL